ncbi:MAG: HlyD family efflux transporter periplasmic adaptor subunit [Chloroflexota bacterium]|nr:HlyD family efflux transporter periplasmic adaptor subunit [Chloroflexota bacterium]
MERFYASLKTLRFTQMLALVVVLLTSAVAVYAWFELPNKNAADGLEEDQQLITIGYGDLIRQVTTSGRLEFPNRQTLNFGIATTLEQLLVQEGESVSAGQELAKPDAVTLTTLSEAVVQAQVNIIEAQEGLDELITPTNLVLTEAQRKVAKSEFDVQEAQAAFDDVLNSAILDLAQARQKVAKAEVDLDVAIEALSDAEEAFTSEQIKTQEQSVATARSKVEDAEEVLRGLSVNFSQSMTKALLDQSDAKAELQIAKDSLEAYETANEVRLENLQEDQLSAQKAYDDNVLRLAELLELETAGSVWDGIHSLEALILIARSSQVTLKDELDTADAALIPYEQLVTKKDKKESDLAKANTTVYDLGGDITMTDLNQQLVKIEEAQDNLGEVTQAGLDATVAEAELASLKLGLSALESGASTADVQLLESDLVQAWATLGKEEESLADMMSGFDAATVELRSKDVDVATATLNVAKFDLEYILSRATGSLSPLGSNPVTEVDIVDPVEAELAKMDLEVAQSGLEQALQELADLLSPDATQVDLLKSKLSSAESAYSAAVEQLEDSVIKAPHAGFISVISAEVGDRVGANAPIVEVVDPSVVEMDGIVDEVDILLLTEGQAASVTVDALPDRTLDGFVSEINPTATIQQGVVTYPVRVQIEMPRGLDLKDGLSAVADLILEQQLDVLLIPQGAIFGSFQEPTVNVETSDGILERPVVLGASDDFWTEVIAGVTAGEMVVMKVSAAADDPYGTFRQFRRGGPPGRGGGPSGGGGPPHQGRPR